MSTRRFSLAWLIILTAILGMVGLVIPQTSFAQASAVDTTAPAKPTNFTATLTNDRSTVNLSWTAATDDIGVVSYLVDRSTDSINWNNLVQNTNQTTLTDSNLPSGSNFHYYRLRAQDGAGNQSDATYADVENVATSADASTEPTTAAPQKRGSLAQIATAVVGSALIIAAIGGAILWFRLRSSRYKQPVVSITPAARADLAPHKSISLKEMVLENYHPESAAQSLPPQERPPGSPPTPAG